MASPAQNLIDALTGAGLSLGPDLQQKIRDAFAGTDRTAAGMQTSLAQQEQFIANLKTINAATATINTLSEAGFATRQRNLDIQIAEKKLREDQLKIVRDAIILGDQEALHAISMSSQLQTIAAYYEDRPRQITREIDALERTNKAREDAIRKLRTESALNVKIINALDKIVVRANMFREGKYLEGMKLIAKDMEEIADKFVFSVLDSAKKQFLELDQAQADFNKNFRFGEEYTGMIQETTIELNRFNVTSKDAAESLGALVKNVSDFVMLSGAQQKTLQTTVALMNELGVSTDASTKAVQINSKFFGVSAGASSERLRELAANAQALGFEQGEYFNMLNSGGRQLAKFGNDGIAVFKSLAHASRITGLEIEKIINLTARFDTFQGAAEQAGKLNAALGGNFVNAMDLMMATDPVERFEMIRDSILNAGLSFNNMSYYQRIFYKEALGLGDVGDLALLLSGNMDMLTEAQNATAESLIEQKNAAKAAQSVTEAFNAIIADNADKLIELAQIVNKFVKAILENENAVKNLITAMIVLKGITIATALANFFLALGLSASLAPALALTAAIGAIATAFFYLHEGMIIESPPKITEYMYAFAEGILVVGAAGLIASAGLKVLGVTMGEIGLGVALAGAGIALMVFSFKSLVNFFEEGSVSIGSFTGALLVMLVPFGLLLAMASYGAPALGAIALATLSLGVSLLMVGAGIAIASLGLSVLMTALKELFEVIDPEKIAKISVSLLGLGGTLGLFAIGGVAAVPGFVALAAGILALSLALRFMPEEKLVAFSTLTSSLLQLTTLVDDFKAVTREIENIADAIKGIPEKKAVALTAAMTKTAAAATAAINVPATGAGGGGGLRQPINITLDGKDVLAKFVLEVVGNEVKVQQSR